MSTATETLTPQEQELRKEAFLIIADLTDRGNKTVNIEFAGSGDDGSIESIYIDSSRVDDTELESRLENWAYALLDATGVDWYNNAGGHGTISIDVAERTYQFTINQYEEVSHLAAEGEVRFGEWGRTNADSV